MYVSRHLTIIQKLQADPNYRRYAYKTLLTVIIGIILS